MKAMILAAGLGNRMRPLTDHLPKPLLPVNGKPLIEFHLENIARAGITQVIINLAYLGDKIRLQLGNGARFGVDIRYSEEPEPLETGGAILNALPLLGDEPFLLINGDVWCELEFAQFIQSAQSVDSRHVQGHLLLVPNPEFHPLGDFALDESGLLLEDTDRHHSNRFTFGGISVLNPLLIAQYPHRRQKFPLVEVLRLAISNQQLAGQVFRGQWSDVGTPERLHELQEHLLPHATRAH
jgi:MurNAc alpha-1-phosphate uridylyltransferase